MGGATNNTVTEGGNREGSHEFFGRRGGPKEACRRRHKGALADAHVARRPLIAPRRCPIAEHRGDLFFDSRFRAEKSRRISEESAELRDYGNMRFLAVSALLSRPR